MSGHVVIDGGLEVIVENGIITRGRLYGEDVKPYIETFEGFRPVCIPAEEYEEAKSMLCWMTDDEAARCTIVKFVKEI